MVKGVTRELFYGMGESPGLVQCMTVFGDGRININTAPRPVLRALATEMADGELEWLDQYRRDARNDLAEAGWHQRIPRASGINILPQLIKINSEIFQITAVGLQGRMTGRITAVVQRQADRRKIKLLSWKVE